MYAPQPWLKEKWQAIANTMFNAMPCGRYYTHTARHDTAYTRIRFEAVHQQHEYIIRFIFIILCIVYEEYIFLFCYVCWRIGAEGGKEGCGAGFVDRFRSACASGSFSCIF